MGLTRFGEIRGQERAASILEKSIAAGRVASAYLFAGPAGVGRKKAAFAFAAALNCLQKGTAPCGECRSCRIIGKGLHPDVRLWKKDPAKKDFPIGLVREIIESLAFKPYEGRYKVAVLDDADLMNQEAANALLMTLEEPPPRTVIILVAANPRLLPETIISRCQAVSFAPLPDDMVAEALLAGGSGREEAEDAALMAEGSLEMAEEFLDESWRTAWKEVLELTEQIVERGPRSVCHRAVTSLRGREDASRTVEALERIFRLSLRRRLGLAGGPCRHVSILSLAARLDRGGFIRAMDKIAGARIMLRGNVNPRLVVEGLVLDLASSIGTGVAVDPRK